MPMKVALLRVAIDSGSGGMQGPLFEDGTFEFIPIPDGSGLEARTYGNTAGRHGRKFIDYFPESRRSRMDKQSIHFDPEFETFTYGDPTPPKAGLRHLQAGDLLVFYCGLRGWNGCESPEGLYLMGYFEVQRSGIADEFRPDELRELFSRNAHVRVPEILADQKDRLVLVKGGPGSRLYKKAVLISSVGEDCAGRPLKILSPEMRKIFGYFDGKLSIQRSPTRWVKPEYVECAVGFIRSRR